MKHKSYTVLQLAAETGIRMQITEQKKKVDFYPICSTKSGH